MNKSTWRKIIMSTLLLIFVFSASRALADEWRRPYPYDQGGYSNDDVYMLPPMVVNGNDPATFDWAGYDAWASQQYNPPPPDSFFTPTYEGQTGGGGGGGGGSGTGALGTTNTSNNTFPYNQTSSSSCAINAVRNAISILKGTNGVPSETDVANRITPVYQDTSTWRFDDSPNPPDKKGLPSEKRTTAYNAALNPEGLKVSTPVNYYTGDGFKELMKSNPDKVFLVGTYMDKYSGNLKGTAPLGETENHAVLFQPIVNGDTITVKIYDSGNSVNGNARVTEVSVEDAASTAFGNSSVRMVSPQ